MHWHWIYKKFRILPLTIPAIGVIKQLEQKAEWQGSL